MATATKVFTAQTFEFRCEVAEGAPVTLNQHKGSALRGALFNSLRKVGCSRQELSSCRPCSLVEVCPVSFLLATVDEEGKRGGDVPRPFAIRPPVGSQNIFQPGDRLDWGLTLFAGSVGFLPYLIVGLQELERDGLGAKSEYRPGRWGRGRLRVREIIARNPLSGETQSLFEIGKKSVLPPEIPVTPDQVAALCQGAPDTIYRLCFTFHTPMRLVAEGKPLAYPQFPVLAQRLIERLSSLSATFGGSELSLDFEMLMAEACAVVEVERRVKWEAVRGYSNRQHQDLSLGGFVGEATFMGKVPNLLPLLVWGQLTHAGKDATKGNGWYSLDSTPLAE
ncbi:MAG TPA: CRISPR system precrRNA processing endoribonuclease RAMP protein Cas6 [Chloroflexia bacterium]|nr:CRISPR system precrRNA processing endoribonuclease RAMP protein Cas6 [Chloroflexia bacterium]